MPVTQLDFPILQRFFCAVWTTTGMPPQPLDALKTPTDDGESTAAPKSLPKGVVLGPDGKPCRTCTSVSSWMAMARNAPPKPSTASSHASSPATASATELPSDCPPDVEQLGRSTWTLLHSLTANYPERPSPTQQAETRQFLGLFGKLYPCWVCADDFRAWMRDGNEPRVSNRDEFGRWMCEAHNAVNVKLGKTAFDCDRWQERWRTGWKDGSCD